MIERPFGYDFKWQDGMERLWARWQTVRRFLWQRIVLSGVADDFRQKPSVRKLIYEQFLDVLLRDLASIGKEGIRPFDVALADIRKIGLGSV